MSSTTHKVHFGQKVAFGLGMLANQMFPAALGIFMVVLVQNLGFPTWMWGVLFFLPRVFDSITDPIMGFISDNTKSVWGRRRQYVFIGAVMMGISFSLMWQLYEVDSLSYNFIYFLIWSLVFYLGLTIFSVPYVAMGYEMSDNFHERTDIMAVAQWIGQWAWVIAPWFWVIMYDPSWFENGAVATRTIAIWVGVICAILAMVPALFIKSTSTLKDDSLTPLTIKTIGGSVQQIINNFKEAFKIEDFKKLCFSTFLIFNAFNTVAGFSFFIVVYYLFNGDTAAAGIWPTLLGSIGALVTTFLVIPAVAKMSKILGKKNAFLWSQGISVVGYVMLWFLFVPGKPYLFLFALPFFSFGIGSLFTLMMSMTSDVIDIDELNTGKRREGVFGAIYWWMVKFGFAIAGLLTGVIMSMVGFVPDAVNSEAAITGIRLFYSGLPIAGTLGAMWIMRNYDLTEERSLEISAALALRKKPVTKPVSSSYYELNKLQSLGSFEETSKYPTDVNMDVTLTELSEHFKVTLEEGLHGICFSPYREGQDVRDTLTGTQIDHRMEVIAPYTKWIRSFSTTKGNELIPLSARSKGIKTLVGAWISADKAQNDLEIQNLIEQAKKGMVDIAVVGNEVLLREELTLDELLFYVRKVKTAVPDIQVGYVDAYYQFVENPQLVEECDVILANCYPFWEGCDIDNATAYLNEMHNIVSRVAKGKSVIITETGWPNQGDDNQNATPSKINAMKYFVNVTNWAKDKGVETFYFSSFDESWKVRQEGEVGARWGLWDKNENLKY
ncbi:MFS transporter [Nonlabens sp.]|uniref:MFS transporter n=1 Tax=Nonlabens sp. TaxID=1888209 RepID=UPI001BCC18E7|nr:MFS transporter [Nonlabens sp.]